MQQLLRSALEGQREALEAFVEAVWPVVQARAALGLMRRALAQKRDLRQELDDLTQAVFHALFEDGARALRAWDPARGLSLTSYVGLLAESQVASILRSGRRSPFTEEPTHIEALDAIAEPVDGFDAQVASRELLSSVVERLKAELSPRGLELFFLLLVEERPVRAVCEQTGMRPDAVYAWRSRLARAARRIAAQLQGETGAADEAAVRRRKRGA